MIRFAPSGETHREPRRRPRKRIEELRPRGGAPSEREEHDEERTEDAEPEAGLRHALAVRKSLCYVGQVFVRHRDAMRFTAGGEQVGHELAFPPSDRREAFGEGLKSLSCRR